jgi:D-alanyl-D-alanine carboxypeptidase
VALGERSARQVTTDQTLIFNPQVEWTGGGLVTRASDLARWVHLLFTERVMSRASLEQMTADPQSPGYPGYEYAMGLEVWRSETLGTAYGQSGFFPGYNSDTLHFPDHGFSIAVQVNCDHPEIAQTRRILGEMGELLRAGRSDIASPSP